METRIYHLVLWVLVACQHTSAQQVHGGYSLWSNWSKCSRSCAGGTQSRSRTCTNPPPVNGGRDCSELGRAKDFKKCNRHTCPVHGSYSQWSYWSQCTKSCGSGTQRRSRSCTNPLPAHGGQNCSGQGQATELQRCNKHSCPVQGGFSKWSDWSHCSQSCGRGKQYRNRFCTNPWPAHGGRGCSSLGPRTELRTCYIRRCPVHGGYSQWSYWSQCTKTCGLGMQRRYRSCTNPRPTYGGRECSSFGPRRESRTCNIQRCPAEMLLLKTTGQFRFCSVVQWILRCKFTDSNYHVYYSTCRFKSRKSFICDSRLHGKRLEYCNVQCPQ